VERLDGEHRHRVPRLRRVRWGEPKKGFATVDATDVTNNTITSNGHGLANADRVILFNVLGETIPPASPKAPPTSSSAAAPTRSRSRSPPAVRPSTSPAKARLYFEKVVPEVFAGQGQITVAIGALVLDATAI
jgi:hypothetical protein